MIVSDRPCVRGTLQSLEHTQSQSPAPTHGQITSAYIHTAIHIVHTYTIIANKSEHEHTRSLTHTVTHM